MYIGDSTFITKPPQLTDSMKDCYNVEVINNVKIVIE